jgi:hypothetical protein
MAAELRFDEVLRVLTRNEVEFIVVGGVAAILQGSPLTTEDVDIVYLDSEQNNIRLAKALGDLEAHYFDPAGRHIEPNAARLASMRVHLLNTNCGRVDVLRAVGKNLAYPDLVVLRKSQGKPDIAIAERHDAPRASSSSSTSATRSGVISSSGTAS